MLNWIRQRIRYKKMAMRERLERLKARKISKETMKKFAKKRSFRAEAIFLLPSHPIEE